ncbi:MAG TPA: cadherin domain-containing protein, partial [Luteolibacter sp.]
ASAFNWQTAVKIGYSVSSSPQYFNGQIDDVCIHNAGLGAADAIALMNAGLNAKPQLSAATLAVAESAAGGTTVGVVSATDADAGQVLTYSIEGGNVGNRFAMDASTGAITVNGPLNYEFISSYVLTVRVSDNGTPSAYADAAVTINVSNVNEAPVFASNPLRGPATPAGTACSGQLSASDPDSGDTFVISKISGPSWLSVASNGTLSGTAPAGDFGLKTFTVRVTDASSAWTEASLELLVVDVATHPLWINAAGGSWSTAANWMSGTIASGSSMVADFSVPNITANTTVALNGSRTIGGLVFGDTDNQYGWTLAPGTGGTLTLDAPGAPVVEVFNQSVALGVPVAGTKGLTKVGGGLLSLTASNTYTGATSVNAGTFSVGNGTTVGALSSSSAISIATGATAQWWQSTGGTIANTISGSGQWVLKGNNSAAALQQSLYTPTATNSGFNGELILDGSMIWSITNPTRYGSGTIRVRNCGSLGMNGTSISNPVIIEDGAGWHHNVNGSDIVLGAMRLEGTNTLSGNIQLNQGTGVIPGETTGANSTFSAWSTSNNTFSGVISGGGELSMSRYTGWNGGTPMVVDFNLTGTASNTFTGLTVVDGQGAKASLRLMKTGGAVAIPGGNVVQMGNSTSTSAANLRMGDVTTVGATRSQWNNQFGTTNGGVLMNFVNVSGQWMRLDLQGTNQSLAGLNAGTDVTQGGAVIQNQSATAFDPGQDATLTLIGADDCLYNGFIRDQDNSGNTRKLHIVKSGSGIQTFAGSQLTYSGTTTVTGGTLRIDGTLANSPVTIGSGGKLDGVGTLNNAVTVASGGTLAAGNDDIGSLTVANSVSFNSTGTLALRIAKSSGLLSSGQINVTGVSALALQGTLSVALTPDSDPLDVGDRFTILSASGGMTGNFTAFNLPALPYNQTWNTGDIATDGSISVQAVPPTQPPVFTPDSGNYTSAQTVSIYSGTDEASI